MFEFFKKEKIREEIKHIADNFCRFKLIEDESCYGIMNGNICGELCFGYKKINIINIKDFYQIKIYINFRYRSLSLFIFDKKLKKDLITAFKEFKYYKQFVSKDICREDYMEYCLINVNHNFLEVSKDIERSIYISDCERKFLYKAFEPKVLEIKQQLEKKNSKRIKEEEKERIEIELQKQKNQNELLKSIKFKGRKKC